MKETDTLPKLLPATKKQPSTDSSPFGKNRYKLYALTAILLLAVYSLLTGTATLKSSADTDTTDTDTLDILEVEEREKLVERMWELYAHGDRIRLPNFWREAFEAAYEELAGDDTESRGAAVYEIARMSMMRLLDPDSSRRSDASAIPELHRRARERKVPAWQSDYRTT